MSKSGSVMFSARNFTQDWFAGQLKSRSLKSIASNPQAFGALFLDYEELLRQHFFANPDIKKAKGLSKDSLMFAFSEYIHDAQTKALAEHMEAHKTTGENLEPIKAWVKAVTGKCSEVDVTVMAQWMWLVKRKGFGKKARYHIMPVLFGPQGAGKSEAIKALIGPMSEFQLNLPMNDIGDSRQFEGMANNLIVFYDELSGIQRTDLNALKNQITTDVNSYRRLNTHITVTVPQSCSFIAASNKRLDEQFTDSTGARRFYEVEVAPKIDWEAINKLGYTAMWRGIDENNDVGYLTGEQLIAVTSVQKQLVTAEDIEIYMDERNYKGEPTKKISSRQAYQDYRIWCVENGIRHELSLGWFVKKLKNRGIDSVTERDKMNVQHRYFLVSADCTIGQQPKIAEVSALKWS